MKTVWEVVNTKLDDVIQQPGMKERMLMAALTQKIHVSIPGEVKAYNPEERTVTVQPVIRQNDNIVTPPLLQDVPVFFPGNLIYPIHIGDECLVIFADRCVDDWFNHGGISSASLSRRHDISDGFALVGFFSKPNVDKGRTLINDDNKVVSDGEIVLTPTTGVTVEGEQEVHGIKRFKQQIEIENNPEDSSNPQDGMISFYKAGAEIADDEWSTRIQSVTQEEEGSVVSPNISFQQKSPMNDGTGLTDYYESYKLPDVDFDKIINSIYEIFTSKNAGQRVVHSNTSSLKTYTYTFPGNDGLMITVIHKLVTVNITSASGMSVYYASVSASSWPVTYKETPIVFYSTYTGGASNAWIWGDTAPSTTSTGKTYVGRGSSYSSAKLWVNYLAIGIKA